MNISKKMPNVSNPSSSTEMMVSFSLILPVVSLAYINYVNSFKNPASPFLRAKFNHKANSKNKLEFEDGVQLS